MQINRQTDIYRHKLACTYTCTHAYAHIATKFKGVIKYRLFKIKRLQISTPVVKVQAALEELI